MDMDAEELKDKIEQGINELETRVSVQEDDEAQELVAEARRAMNNAEWIKGVQKLQELKNYAENNS